MDAILGGRMTQSCQIWSNVRQGVRREGEPGWFLGGSTMRFNAFRNRALRWRQLLESDTRRTAARILLLQCKGLRLPFVSGRLPRPDSSLSWRSR